MKYLITGATGAIGSAIVRQLAAEGKEVRTFVRDAEKFHFPGNTWVFGRPARLPITPDMPFNPPSPIARSTLDDRAAALGAALALIDHIFSAPLEKSPIQEMIVK